MRPARLLPLPSLLLLIALGLGLASGCASAPEIGVRPTFENARVTKVAVVPLYATSRFSQPAEEHARIVALYQAATERWLAEEGFEVVGAEALRAHLEANEALQIFEDGMDLRGPLNRYFEPDQQQRMGVEVETLRGLYAAGKLPADVLLMGEVVYQTDATCRVPTTQYTDYADVITAPVEGGRKKPEPPVEARCVVSHFQAKLIDARTGQTMWHNRFLRELRDPPITEAKRHENIDQTVRTTLGGDHGMRRFLRSTGSGSSAEAAAAARE